MPANRIDALDALRGLAMLWMTLYHLCFDLSYFGHWSQDFYGDVVWTTQRTLIVSLFLFCAGFSQAWVVAQGQSARRFWRRWWQIAGCAVLVSMGSWLMFPNSWIYFGVLHGIAIMMLVVRWGLRWGQWLWLVGLLVIGFHWAYANWVLPSVTPQAQNWLDARALNWLGWISRKPITEDYVPLFPWLGVMCWGAAAAQWLLVSGRARQIVAWHPWRWLVRLGRWSLSYYMLHQIVLISIVAGFTQFLM